MARIALPCHDLPYRVQQQVLRCGGNAAAQGHSLRMQDIHQVRQTGGQVSGIVPAHGQGCFITQLRRLKRRPAIHSAVFLSHLMEQALGMGLHGLPHLADQAGGGGVSLPAAPAAAVAGNAVLLDNNVAHLTACAHPRVQLPI